MFGQLSKPKAGDRVAFSTDQMHGVGFAVAVLDGGPAVGVMVAVAVLDYPETLKLPGAAVRVLEAGALERRIIPAPSLA